MNIAETKKKISAIEGQISRAMKGRKDPEDLRVLAISISGRIKDLRDDAIKERRPDDYKFHLIDALDSVNHAEFKFFNVAYAEETGGRPAQEMEDAMEYLELAKADLHKASVCLKSNYTKLRERPTSSRKKVTSRRRK